MCLSFWELWKLSPCSGVSLERLALLAVFCGWEHLFTVSWLISRARTIWVRSYRSGLCFCSICYDLTAVSSVWEISCREALAQKLIVGISKLLFTPFWCQYISGCRASVPRIVVADSCFPGRSIYYHSFFVLHPSCSPSWRFPLSSSGMSRNSGWGGILSQCVHWVTFLVAPVDL